MRISSGSRGPHISNGFIDVSRVAHISRQGHEAGTPFARTLVKPKPVQVATLATNSALGLTRPRLANMTLGSARAIDFHGARVAAGLTHNSQSSTSSRNARVHNCGADTPWTYFTGARGGDSLY